MQADTARRLGARLKPEGFCHGLLGGLAALLALVLAAGPALAAPRPVLDLNDSGVEVRWGEKTLVGRMLPAMEHVVFEERTVNPENDTYEYAFPKGVTEVLRTEVDAGAGRVTRHYPWGQMRVRFVLEGGKLTLRVAIENEQKEKPIANFRMRLLEASMPAAGEAIEKHGQVQTTWDKPVAIGLPVAPGRLYTAYETFYPPIHFGYGKAAEDGATYPLLASGGVQAEPKESPLVVPPLGIPQIPPGRTLELKFTLRFTDAAMHRHEALADFYEAYRSYHEPMLDWPDRRPIGATFLMSEWGKIGNQFGIDGINPRRYFSPSTDGIDMLSPHGNVILRKKMRQLAQSTVVANKQLNSQGIILWNVEGGFHSTAFIGDPRMVPITNPELDGALDDYFQIIRDAGLKTGLTLRPTQLRWNEGNGTWGHGPGNVNPNADPFKTDYERLIPEHVQWWRVYPVARRMSEKIAYAKDRWGCTIFYLDTSMIWRPRGRKMNMAAQMMSAHVYREIRRRHPDVLLIPEVMKQQIAYVGHMAPYGQTGFGRVRPTFKQDYLRDIFPHYFGALYIHDTGGDPYLNQVDHVNQLVWGEAFITDAWSPGSPNQDAIIEFWNHAGATLRRTAALARRFTDLREDIDLLPLSYPFEKGRRIDTGALVADPPASDQLRAATASSADRREAMLMLAWYGWPYSPGTTLKASLPGVDLAGEHRRVWDVASGRLLSSGDRVHVPAAPVEMFRSLYVRSAETPAPERPEGLMLNLTFDRGLVPDSGEDLLTDHGDATLGSGAHGRALEVRSGAGTASYGVVPNWLAGTLEFDLHVRDAAGEPLTLLRFQHHMETNLALVEHEGKPALRLRSYERAGEKAYWKFETLSPIYGQSPELREKIVPLPEGGPWHHVTLVWESGLFRLYVDGERLGLLADAPAMARPRDASLFEPGLVLGAGEAGGGKAQLDSVALYDWSFGEAHATGRGVGAGREPLAKPDDLLPSVWLWGHKPEAVKYATVNFRGLSGGERIQRTKLTLFEKTEDGLRRLIEGKMPAWRGTASLLLEYEPEAAMEISVEEPEEEEMGVLSDLVTSTKEYVLRVQSNHQRHRRDIPLRFGMDDKPLRHWTAQD